MKRMAVVEDIIELHFWDTGGWAVNSAPKQKQKADSRSQYEEQPRVSGQNNKSKSKVLGKLPSVPVLTCEVHFFWDMVGGLSDAIA